MSHPTRKARKTKSLTNLDFAFHGALQQFLAEGRRQVRAQLQPLSRKFLDYNDPQSGTAWLRQPQFEALEIYVFLKEVCHNRPLYRLFEDWYEKKGVFEGRTDLGTNRTGQTELFNVVESASKEDKEAFRAAFTALSRFQQKYPNYIFALTMGLGKTVLMATCIFYEFLLANKFPASPLYCHNALVFAPDKTVLQSLQEIQTMDKDRVVPPEYVAQLESNLRFHFLDDSGLALSTLDGSAFNIVISNTQKVILKRKNAKPKAAELLFQEGAARYRALSMNKAYDDLYDFETDIETEQELASNQRFNKLIRLKQLGIYVDEAHHLFGTSLEREFATGGTGVSSLRLTINELAEQLEKAGSRVVACYNFTGTPYVKNNLLPEVVYAYGLREAINNKYLKLVQVSSFTNIKGHTEDLVRLAVSEFMEHYGGQRYEGMLPKMAFFATTIAELQTELRPTVEKVLAELGLPASSVLVNVGDDKITTNDDLREFRLLDTPGSQKQFILLVNKGKEGWNCRSLFSVVLHREPKSKIFVLQAAMRCLRKIGDLQAQARVYLSKENYDILDNELRQNFRLTVDELNSTGETGKKPVEVRLVPPPVKIKLRKVTRRFELQARTLREGIDLELDQVPIEDYQIIRKDEDLRKLGNVVQEEEVTYRVNRYHYTELTLVAEIARFFNPIESNYVSPMRIRELLVGCKQGMQAVLDLVNGFNQLLYDWVIPRLFGAIFKVVDFKGEGEEIEVELVKTPQDGYYRVKADPNLLINYLDAEMADYRAMSFHLDNYCFDSKPEYYCFKQLLKDPNNDKVWFTGMFTHGQSEFVVSYVDPDSHTVRSYYPDFLVKTKAGEYLIIEIKRDDQIDDRVVRAKAEYAKQMAIASGMDYKLIKAGNVPIG